MPFTVLNEADALALNAAYGFLAEPDSTDIAILVAADDGVGVLSGCAVTAQGTPNMTVAVAAGEVRSPLDKAVAVTAGNVTITANATGNYRLDLVNVTSAGVKQATAGTAAADPALPALPASAVALAAVVVPPSATAIATAQIVDKRVNVERPAEFVNAYKWSGI